MNSGATNNTIDGASVAVLLATIVGWLPPITAILVFILTVIRLYETKTVQRWLGRE